MKIPKKKPGPKPGKPKQYATFYIECELLDKKPDSKLINQLLRNHYNNQKIG